MGHNIPIVLLSIAALPSFLKRKRRIGAFVIAAILVWIVGSHILNHNKSRLRPNQVIDAFGNYSLPNGRDHISILKTAEGNVRVTLFHQRRKYYFLKTFVPEQPTEFEAEREWFLSVDDYERIWIFIGRWDRKWGELRQMPSGGFVPYPPAVLMNGCWFDSSGDLFRGSMEVSETGDWAGIPAEFFDRIPENDKLDCGLIPASSSSPPQFTEQQKLRLISRLKERAN